MATVPDVVCAIRGGPGSYHARLGALQHAAASEVTVHFVSVIDPVAYQPLHEGEQHAIRAEMAWRDVALARATAAHAELGDVRFTVAVRVGELATTIGEFANEVGASSILIGRPRLAADAALAGGQGKFVEELGRCAGLPVNVIGSGDGA